MQRTLVYKLKPNREQAEALQHYLDITRAVYNAALQQRISAYRSTGRAPSRFTQAGEIKQLRAAGMLEGCHVHAAQGALKRLDLAYAAFFRRCAAGAKRKGFPRFRGHRHWRSIQFQEWGNGVRLDEQSRRLRVSAVGAVRIRLHRPLEGRPKTCTLVHKADGWYAHIVVRQPESKPLPDVEPTLRGALDLGVEALATLHTGERIANCRALAQARSKLLTEQRALARKRRGSRRRDKQRERVARAHVKVTRVRRDHLHKCSAALTERYRFIAVEDLTVTAMVASAKGTIGQPGRRVAQKAGLNRSILDAGWGEFLAMLDYKLAERGGELVRVNPRGTSQECSACGTSVRKALGERSHECPHCGLSVHRDHNAALNIHQRAWAVPVAEAA